MYGIVTLGERKMRRERKDRLESEIKKLEELTDNLGRQIENTGRKKYLKPKSLAKIEKRLEKKNLELEEVREFRKKLNEKEKEICVAIEKLENEKMEVIFEQVKRGIKSENLDVSSESVLKMLGALRKEKYVDGKLETSNDVV